MDRLTPKQRSKTMTAVRSKDTKPELFVRRQLHARGFRFRLHRKDLPGKPDIVFPSRKCVIFVHGCFWHGHGCRRDVLPATRREYWGPKIKGNMARDERNRNDLEVAGWSVLIVWECDLRQAESIDSVAAWLDAHTVVRGPKSGSGQMNPKYSQLQAGFEHISNTPVVN